MKLQGNMIELSRLALALEVLKYIKEKKISGSSKL